VRMSATVEKELSKNRLVLHEQFEEKMRFERTRTMLIFSEELAAF